MTRDLGGPWLEKTWWPLRDLNPTTATLLFSDP